MRRSRIAEGILDILRDPPEHVSMTTTELQDELALRGKIHEWDPINKALINLRNMGLINKLPASPEEPYQALYALREYYERSSYMGAMNRFILEYLYKPVISPQFSLMLEYVWGRVVAEVYTKIVEALYEEDQEFVIPEEYKLLKGNAGVMEVEEEK